MQRYSQHVQRHTTNAPTYKKCNDSNYKCNNIKYATNITKKCNSSKKNATKKIAPKHTNNATIIIHLSLPKSYASSTIANSKISENILSSQSIIQSADCINSEEGMH